MRVKFGKGDQRKFIQKVLLDSRCPSLRSLISRGFNVPYSTLKSYYNENRLLPKNLFEDLCIFSNILQTSLKFVYIEENWGQVLGGSN